VDLQYQKDLFPQLLLCLQKLSELLCQRKATLLVPEILFQKDEDTAESHKEVEMTKLGTGTQETNAEKPYILLEQSNQHGAMREKYVYPEEHLQFFQSMVERDVDCSMSDLLQKLTKLLEHLKNTQKLDEEMSHNHWFDLL